MGQCFSGGFIGNLENENTIIMTACGDNQYSYPADDLFPDAADTLENEAYEYIPHAFDYYHHSEFNYHTINSQRMETVGYFNYLWEPDTDFNNLTSILEVKEWHFLKNSRIEFPTIETPQYSDPGGIGGEIFLNIPPYKPQNLQLENVSNQTHLTWDPNLEYDLDHYNIYRYISMDQGPPPAYWPLIGQTEETEFTDPEFAPVPGGPETAMYRITAVDEAEQESEYSDPVGSHGYVRPGSDGAFAATEIPLETFSLSLHPNPFNTTTHLSFDLPNAGDVSLVVYDVQGKEIARLVEGWKSAGSYDVTFDGSQWSSGVYFACFKAEGFSQTWKLLLIK
ncbi:MAG: T9SS type A sorting domain-containing protein [FCB group bacterium]|nr:T9SS type A sorting domain-containing protein [FCB group bacterium]